MISRNKQMIRHVRKMFRNNELLDIDVGKHFISFKVGLKKPLHVPEGLHTELHFNGFDEYIHLAIRSEVIAKKLPKIKNLNRKKIKKHHEEEYEAGIL